MKPTKEAILFHDLVENYEHYRQRGEHETAKEILGVLVSRVNDHVANYPPAEPEPMPTFDGPPIEVSVKKFRTFPEEHIVVSAERYPAVEVEAPAEDGGRLLRRTKPGR